jgi:hypothetical protein
MYIFPQKLRIVNTGGEKTTGFWTAFGWGIQLFWLESARVATTPAVYIEGCDEGFQSTQSGIEIRRKI